jgi:hypothetical protein
MQAIQTRYFGPTDSRGSRIKAWAAAGSITIPYPYELSGQACHRAAAEALALRLEWDTPFYGSLLGGCLPNGDYVFVWNNNYSKE